MYKKRWVSKTETSDKDKKYLWANLYDTEFSTNEDFAPCDNPKIKAGTEHKVSRKINEKPKDLHRFCSEKCRIEYIRACLYLKKY